MRGWMRGALGVVAVGLFWMAVAYAVMPSSQERPPPLEVSIELLPRLRPTPGVAVFMTLRGRALAGVRSLAMAPAKGPDRGIDGLKHLLLKDERGMLLTRDDPRPGHVALARAVAGDELHVSYLVESPEQPRLHDVRVDEQGVRALGHGLLALPPQQENMRVSLRWSLRALEVPEAATSFGFGREVSARASSFDLAHAFYVAGPLTLREGRHGDRLVIWGKPGFDPDEALAICEKALATAHRMFEPRPAGRSEPSPRTVPHSFVFFSEPALGGRHDGLAFHRSFGVWVSEDRALDARVRVLIAHEIVHRWLGGRLRLNRPDGSDAAWFSEGFTVHYARKLLRRAQLVSEEDLADDLRRTLAAQRREIAERLASARPGPRAGQMLAAKPHPSAAYHRGALYAARVEAQLAARGLDLDELIRDLIARAPAQAAGLPESAWRAMVEAKLGPFAGEELDRLVIRAEEPIEISEERAPAGGL